MKERKDYRTYSLKYGKGQGYISTTFRQMDYTQLYPWVILRKGGPMEITGWLAIYCVVLGSFIPPIRILAWVGLILILMFLAYWIIYWAMKFAGKA
jgi:hypothetical protein